MESNKYVMCSKCQMTYFPEQLTDGLCSLCQIKKTDQAEWLDSMTEAEKDEYSQCIACEEVIDNEFISEHGVCIECLRSDLRALEGNLHPRTKFCFVFKPNRPTSKATLSTLKKNGKLSGEVEVIINAESKEWAWSALIDLIAENELGNRSEWKLK